MRILAAAFILSCGAGLFGQSAPIELVPAPAPGTLRSRTAPLEMSSDFEIRFLAEAGSSAKDEGWLLAHAEVLASELELLLGRRPRVCPAGMAGEDHGPGLDLRLAAWRRPAPMSDLSRERYRLQIGARGATMRAFSVAGLARASASLLQLLRVGPNGEAKWPGLSLEEEPHCAYRSVMIDVARQPHSLESLRDAIRLARLYKIPIIQLHLTDDQHFTFPFAPITDRLEGNHVYAREDLIELVRYAAVRGVTLVPEIDLPGHSSRLRQSGYLKGAKTDRDVASAEHFPALALLFDEVMEVFSTSPYFHVGGDESGAGRELIPFLARVQKHVRRRGRRLIVWEGFHGAPTKALPPRGEDRVLVASWESSYNAPWNLLTAGYEIINASWKPLYIVGGDTLVHPGSSGGRMWSPATIATWNKDIFDHWEPGRPVYEDRGPEDSNRDDHRWPVPRAWRPQVLGGQISVWEQKESSLIRELRYRLPVLAERLWTKKPTAVAELQSRIEAVDARIFGIVQPVEILPAGETGGPIDQLFRSIPEGKEAPKLRLRNRTRLESEFVWVHRPFSARFGWIDQPKLPDLRSDGEAFRKPRPLVEGIALRAQLRRSGGELVEGSTWARFLPWPSRLRVREFDTQEESLPRVPDFAIWSKSKIIDRYELPFIRGPIGGRSIRGQMLEGSFQVPKTGAYTLSLKTQSGRASLYVDLDGDGRWDAEEKLLGDSPRSEKPITALVSLEKSKVYRLRIDHVTGLPRPVLIATLKAADAARARDLSEYLVPLTIPPGVRPLPPNPARRGRGSSERRRR